MVSVISSAEYLSLTNPKVGHIRPLLVLASKIVATRNIHVTLLFDNHGPDIDKIPVELERRKSEEGPIKGRIRFVRRPRGTLRLE